MNSITFGSWPLRALLALALALSSAPASAQGTPLPQRAFGHGAFVGEMVPPGPLVAPKFQAPNLAASAGAAPIVTREVLGYLPYWSISSGYTVQRWDLLTILAWFAAEMDSEGNITAYHGWGGATTEALVQEAHAHGVKVIVTVTNFNDTGIGSLLHSATFRANAIASCLALMATHGADGVNIDFEFVPVSAKAQFVSFMTELKAAVAEVQPNGWDGHVSLAGPSVDWSGAYDYDQLLINTDGIMVMAYGYHWGGGSPGPTSPLYGGNGFSNLSVASTIDEYIEFGGIENRHKIMIGLPWYGRDWMVADTTIPGTSLGGSGAVFFIDAEAEAAVEGKQWDDHSKTAYYHIQRTGGLYQVWYDDGPAFYEKVAYVDDKDLGGIGIWALGYDGDLPDLWDAIETVLVAPETPPDAQPDAPADAPPEAAVEAQPEAFAEAQPEAQPEPHIEVLAEAQPEPGPEPGPEPAPELAPEIAPEAQADAAGTPPDADSTGGADTWTNTGSSALVTTASSGCGSGGSGGSPWTVLLFAGLGLFYLRLSNA